MPNLSDLANGPMLTPEDRRRLAKPVPSGHAAKPGTGPAGETCGTCGHLFRNEMAKTYLKCGLMRAKWTGGIRTDIRAKDHACSKWERASQAAGKEG